MRLPISMLLATILIVDVADAKNDQVARGPAPEWVVPSELMVVPDNTSGLLFFRRQDNLVHLDQEGQQHYSGYRVKILHPNALQMGNLSIAWNPASGAPMVHAIRIHRGDESIDILEKASFEILRREDQLEQAKLDGTLTAVLRVADLRVGDELEFNVTTRSSDPTLGKNDAGLLYLSPNPLPGRFRLGLSWDEGYEPKVKMTGDMSAIAARRDRAIEFRFDNPGAFNAPKDAPPRYTWQRVVEYSDFSDWAAISRLLAPLFDKAAKFADQSPLKLEASRIASAHALPFDRARAALKLVQQDVRYIYVGLNGGNLTPASSEDSWKRRYGDCKGKTALLLGLLAELGIKAEAVLASNAGSDDGLDERLPSAALFDHVLVRAQIDGKSYWLDGTLPPVAMPSIIPVPPYRWILPLSTQGRSIERLAWQPQEVPDEINLYEIDAREGFDKQARITSTTIVRGSKGLQQQMELSAVTSGQLLDAFRQEAIGDTWQVIDDVKWRFDEPAQASILTIIGKGTVDWDDDGDGAKSLSLPGGGFSPPRNGFEPATRSWMRLIIRRPIIAAM